ncbi:barstar family protein [[Clostridium] hylemonae]|uniref:barstar family protein n=1 Tax=[Clostridium] hylemonae TaxID=89153 RepID=UPI001D074EB4|nr:barstar family protein [[Clostridium] hylemonae]MCB7520679.1 barstar family protein [[Clostridium] hylemonae]BDF05392.1 putative ribonuclease inhibitor YrdF [[Clostridium] hylemonae]
MKEVILDAAHMQKKEEAHVYLREKLGFPDYYGANLDALYDCLTECAGLRVIVLNHAQAGPYASAVIQIMMDADAEVELR